MERKTKAQSADAQVEAALLRKATGYTYTQMDSYKLKKILYDDKGKKEREDEEVQVVEVEKYVPPDFSAIAMWLKARLPEKWGDGTAAAQQSVVPIIDDIPAQSGPPRAANG